MCGYGALRTEWRCCSSHSAWWKKDLKKKKEVRGNEEQCRASHVKMGNKEPIRVDGACASLRIWYSWRGCTMNLLYIQMKSRVGQLFISKKLKCEEAGFKKRERGVGAQTRNCQCHCNQGEAPAAVRDDSHLSSLFFHLLWPVTKKNWKKEDDQDDREKIPSLFVMK